MVTVELSPAYVWDCDQCGRENFQRSISRILDPEDVDDADLIRRLMEVEDYEETVSDDGERFSVQTRPTHVICRFCNTRFKAADFIGKVVD